MTLCLHVHFITGRYAASAYNDRSVAEWPPHPARVFSALVATLHDGGVVDSREAEALDELALLAPPEVVASEANARRVMTTFVPVNDAAVTDNKGLWTREEKVRVAREAVLKLSQDATARERKQAVTRLERERKGLLDLARNYAAKAKRPKDNRGLGVLPWGRTKQPRCFPSVTPLEPTVSFVWREAKLASQSVEALHRLSARVVRLGHSTSFVHIRVEFEEGGWSRSDDDGRLDWRPDPRGNETLRVMLPTQRTDLERAYRHHQGDLPGRVLPARHVRYTRSATREDIGRTSRSGGRWIAYEFAGKSLPPAEAAVAIADRVRQGLLKHAQPRPHAQLSGRTEEGEPLREPHLAFIPLPFVGHRHADGALRGFALCLPRKVSPAADQALLAALGQWEASGRAEQRTVEVELSSRTVVAQRVVDPAVGLKTLNPWRWAAPSRRWATVTPIALDGHCDALNHSSAARRRRAWRTAAKLVRAAIVRAVEPPPGRSLESEEIAVSLVFDAPVVGGAHLGSVPPYKRPGHEQPRRLVHAVIELPFPIQGPLLLGSGRHFGLGLCLPSDANKVRPEVVEDAS